MLVDLPWGVAVAVDAAAWLLLSVAVGSWFARRPAAALAGRGPLLRLRAFERDGRWYERRLRIRAWKDRLPEAGGWLGGRSKRHAGDRDAFRAACVRGESVHWTLLLVAPAFLLWNPPGLALAMVAFALLANGPCLAVLRYNRARLVRIARRAERGRHRR